MKCWNSDSKERDQVRSHPGALQRDLSSKKLEVNALGMKRECRRPLKIEMSSLGAQATGREGAWQGTLNCPESVPRDQKPSLEDVQVQTGEASL